MELETARAIAEELKSRLEGAMEKTIELVLKSPLCEERVEVPAKLWRDFEKKAKELHMTPEELLPIALRAYIMEEAA